MHRRRALDRPAHRRRRQLSFNEPGHATATAGLRRSGLRLDRSNATATAGLRRSELGFDGEPAAAERLRRRLGLHGSESSLGART
jgi:hypothetical protein